MCLSIIVASITIISFVGGIFWWIFTKLSDLKDCQKRVGSLEEKQNDTGKTLWEYNGRIVSIETTLALKLNGTIDSVSRRRSPRTLNDLGARLFAEMNGEKFLQDNKDVLFAKIDERKPKAGLDVEIYASLALALCVHEDFFIPIKNYVYNRAEIETEGGTKIDMTLETACYILSMPLRDLYLQEHPEIPTTNND